VNVVEQSAGTSSPDGSAVLIEIPSGLEALAHRYLASRYNELPLLEALLECSDYEQIRRLSHNMKGTGTSYGFPDVTRLGSAMEMASKERDSSNIAKQMNALSTYVHSAIRQLQLTI